MDHCLVVKNLSKSYGSLPVLDNWNLSLSWGQRLVLLGPSGAGKTTFLRILSGLEAPGNGHISNCFNKTGFVFQEPRLIPWRSVRENLLFVNPKGEYKQILSRLRLTGFEDYFPSQLSAGMRQRVNLARALLSQPDLLILDEAYSSLDLSVKSSIMEDINQLWLENPFSIIAVTHDPKEALYMADRIIILSPRPARIMQEIKVTPGLERSFSSPGLLQLESSLIKLLCSFQSEV